MPPPERPSALNIGLTRENLEGVTAGSRPDSIRDKMARYEGTHVDTIERLTGLRYQEGERSRGITTGNASPTLIKGDAGIAIPMDRDPRTGEKKKKLKVAEEYVCTDCGEFARHLRYICSCFSDVPPQALLTPPNGARDPVVPRHYVMRAVCDGPRRRRKGTRTTPAALEVVAAWEAAWLSWMRARRENGPGRLPGWHAV
jgi:hypothetical protein